ncbi:hypothetical protein KTH89_06700 [Lachnospiraceae bacterium ASD5720]|uniref:Uncharacterized protein n=1 Tax=Diplocloster agilis TaxID=2850323 RepID=A0A949K6R6_9FIRM|nr:hypothetical protein [Diplocloster agilis]
MKREKHDHVKNTTNDQISIRHISNGVLKDDRSGKAVASSGRMMAANGSKQQAQQA